MNRKLAANLKHHSIGNIQFKSKLAAFNFDRAMCLLQQYNTVLFHEWPLSVSDLESRIRPATHESDIVMAVRLKVGHTKYAPIWTLLTLSG